MEHQYKIGDRVVITETGRPGQVRGIYIGEYGPVEYLVRYVDRADVVQSAYLRACELRPAESGADAPQEVS